MEHLIVQVFAGKRNEVRDAEPRMVSLEEAERIRPGITKQFEIPDEPVLEDESEFGKKQFADAHKEWKKIRDGMPSEMPLQRFHDQTTVPKGFYIVTGKHVADSDVVLSTSDQAPWSRWSGPYPKLAIAKEALAEKEAKGLGKAAKDGGQSDG